MPSRARVTKEASRRLRDLARALKNIEKFSDVSNSIFRYTIRMPIQAKYCDVSPVKPGAGRGLLFLSLIGPPSQNSTYCALGLDVIAENCIPLLISSIGNSNENNAVEP